MGRQRHERVYVGMPIRYQVKVAESPENPWICLGILENVSHGGLYFRTIDTPPLEEGQIRDFTFTATEEHPNYPETDFIIASGRVVRIDPPEPAQQDIGVALEFFWVKFPADFKIACDNNLQKNTGDTSSYTNTRFNLPELTSIFYFY
jgi:hypothetical protein